MTGRQLRSARRKRGMSTQYIADLIGVHRNTVGRWESGGKIPGPAQISLKWILGLSDPKLRKAAGLTSGANVQTGK